MLAKRLCLLGLVRRNKLGMWTINRIWLEKDMKEIIEFTIGSLDLSKIQEFVCSYYAFLFNVHLSSGF